MKKRLLTVMVTVLAVLMLAACGDSKEASSDSVKEKKNKVESEVEKDTAKEDKTNQEYSGDGGAHVDGETTGENTETDTEVVEPVSTTFTLVDEDGTVVFEGNVPANLTLVDGNGTSHIEFAYTENSDVSVYLDAGLDYDVLAAYTCYDFDSDGLIPESNVECVKEALDFYGIDAATLSIDEQEPYTAVECIDRGYPLIDGDKTYGLMLAEANNYIKLDDRVYPMEKTHVIKRFVGISTFDYIPIDPTVENDFGYAIWKGCALSDKTTNEMLEYPFTISLKVTQPDFNSLSEDERENVYYTDSGYYALNKFKSRDLLMQIIKSFNN